MIAWIENKLNEKPEDEHKNENLSKAEKKKLR